MDGDGVAERLARRFGPAVTSWVAGLPDLTGRLAAHWDLTLGAPIDAGASSVAYRVRAGSRRAVLKVSPEPAFLAEQAAVLRVFAPSGRVPEVLASAEGALLMAEIVPGTCADELPVQPDPAVYAELVHALHAVPAPRDLVLGRTLRERVEEFLHRAMRQLGDPVVAARLREEDFRRALALLDDVLAMGAPDVLLHGDLHLGNVLLDSETLVAIDPKACVGDACFDVVDYVLAGAGRPDGIEYRLAGLVAAGFDADRLRAWARLVAAVTVIPLLRNGNHQAAVEELLVVAR